MSTSVVVNGEECHVDERTSIAELVRQVRGDEAGPGVAVALNGEVVARRDWEHAVVDEGDRIEILVATQGG